MRPPEFQPGMAWVTGPVGATEIAGVDNVARRSRGGQRVFHLSRQRVPRAGAANKQLV